MPRSVIIAPSILSADFGRLAEEVGAVSRAGADYIHFDVMDGCFVPNITVGPAVLECVRRSTAALLDVHLMIVEPDRHLQAFAEAGAGVITVHAEAATHLHRTLQRIRQLGCRAGVCLNPATPLTAVEHVLGELDLLLVMTVNPGFGGQRFIRSMLPKLRAARRLLDDAHSGAVLEVDGGVILENVAEVCGAGATAVVAGTGIFKTPSYAETIAAMRSAVAASAADSP